jgi:hypothetical protein
VLVTNQPRFSEGRFWTLAGAVLGPETLPFGRVAFVPSVAVGYQYCSACYGLVDPNDVDAMCMALIHPQYPATAKEIEVLLSSPKWTAESKAVRRKLRDFCDDCLNNKSVTARNVASVHPCCAQKPGALGCSLRRHNPQKWYSPVFKEVITAVPAPPMQQGKKPIVLLNLAPVVIREDNWFGELDMMHARQVGYNVTTALHEHGKPQ